MCSLVMKKDIYFLLSCNTFILYFTFTGKGKGGLLGETLNVLQLFNRLPLLVYGVQLHIKEVQ